MASEGSKSRRRPPAKTPEEREQQLVGMAFDYAEKQFHAGTASSQVTVHFLKLGSERERMERIKLDRENILLEARTRQIESQAHTQELIEDALKVMRQYSGLDHGDEDE